MSISLPASVEGLKSDLLTAKRAFSLAAALPRFFRARVTREAAREEITRRLETKVQQFIELVRTRVYESPRSPYRALLTHAGCDFSDFRTHADRHGVEATLAKLAQEGVYLTSDEFKGKVDVVRGNQAFRVSPDDFKRPGSPAGFAIQSSGTRNAPLTSWSPLDARAIDALGTAIYYEAHDVFSHVNAVYEPVIAGRMLYVVINGKLGIGTDRWFALDVPAHSAAESRYHRLNAGLVSRMGTWFGPGIAKPTYLRVGDVKPIIEWISEQRRRGRRCCISTVVSNAVRIARVASTAGISLEGTLLRVSGEPLTPFKRELLERAGARVAVLYGPGGGNGAALGCGNPMFTDEMHVPETMFTFVEHPRPLAGSTPAIHPLMLTTLHASAPRFLLNVQNGDHAIMLRRNCGCALEQVGFTQHLHTVRSFEKFTSEGMNYFTTDLVDLLEQSIPSEFGGGPGDYQLVEEEDERGQTRLTLVVHPDVGHVDEAKLLSRLSRGLASGSRNNNFMSTLWANAETFRVERRAPHASVRGKVTPLRINL